MNTLKSPFNRDFGIPAEQSCGKLAHLAGAELENQHSETLKKLGENMENFRAISSELG